MAGDWIKMRVGLTTNPRVMRIAECLLDDSRFMDWAGLSYGIGGYPSPSPEQTRAERHAALRVTRYVTVTALLRWWGYANEHAKGDEIAGLFPEDVDEIAGVPGFAEAINTVGWVDFDDEFGARLPNFSEHNTSAGARSSGAERQKKYREKQRQAGSGSDENRNVTRDVTVTPREEKRREEEKKEKRTRGKAKVCTLTDWIAELGDNDAVPADDPIFDWAAKVGIPRDWIALAWWAFEGRYTGDGQGRAKTYADWRATFRNAVREDWLKLWRHGAEGYVLTTAGQQAQRERSA